MSTLLLTLCLKEHIFPYLFEGFKYLLFMLINILFKKLSNDREIQVMDYIYSYLKKNI